jgi:hypothetical protein
MMNTSYAFFCALKIASFVLMAVPVPAQLGSSIMLALATEGGRHGYLAAGPGPILTWHRSASVTSPAQASSILLPMNRPWHACRAGNGMYLVVGTDTDASTSQVSNEAKLVAVQLDPALGTVSLVSSEQYSGRDLRRIFFNAVEQLVYAIDASTSSLMVAPWTVGSALPTSLSLAVDSSAIPFLTERWLPILKARDVGTGVSVRAGHRMDYFGDIVGYGVRYSGPSWIVESEVASGTGSNLPQWNFGNYIQNTRAATVSVAGVVGQFAIALAGGADVITGVTTSDGVTSVPMAPGTLLPGASYTIRGLNPSASSSPILPINSSWGQACPGPALQVVRGLIADCYVGNSSFRATSQLHWVAESEVVATHDLFLILGFAIPGAEDVTVGSSGCATIDSIAAIIGPIATKVSGANPGLASVALPVPADTGLTGLHVLMQWVAVDGTQLALSEVHGSLVFPAPALSASAAGGGVLVPGSAAAQHAKHCAEAWCDSRPEMAWNHEKRELRKKIKKL